MHIQVVSIFMNIFVCIIFSPCIIYLGQKPQSRITRSRRMNNFLAPLKCPFQIYWIGAMPTAKSKVTCFSLRVLPDSVLIFLIIKRGMISQYCFKMAFLYSLRMYIFSRGDIL